MTVFEDARGAAVLAASDLGRARGFYENVLGLAVEEDVSDDEAVFYRLGGTRLMIYRSDFAGTAQNTAFVVETDDLGADMSQLRQKGVAFKDYDFPGLTTRDGVATLETEKTAWFEDTEGNILALSERL